MTAFNFDMTDEKGFTPSADRTLIGQQLVHSGNGKTYTILDFVWMGATDEWGFLHRAAGENGPLLCRPLSQLTGNREDGTPRYSSPAVVRKLRQMALHAALSRRSWSDVETAADAIRDGEPL